MIRQCSILFGCLALGELIVYLTGVALMLYFDVITAQFWPIVIATLVSTILVLVVTGWVHQLVRKYGFFRK